MLVALRTGNGDCISPHPGPLPAAGEGVKQTRRCRPDKDPLPLHEAGGKVGVTSNSPLATTNYPLSSRVDVGVERLLPRPQRSHSAFRESARREDRVRGPRSLGGKLSRSDRGDLVVIVRKPQCLPGRTRTTSNRPRWSHASSSMACPPRSGRRSPVQRPR